MGKRSKLDNPIEKGQIDDHGDSLKTPNPIENNFHFQKISKLNANKRRSRSEFWICPHIVQSGVPLDKQQAARISMAPGFD